MTRSPIHLERDPSYFGVKNIKTVLVAIPGWERLFFFPRIAHGSVATRAHAHVNSGFLPFLKAP